MPLARLSCRKLTTACAVFALLSGCVNPDRYQYVPMEAATDTGEGGVAEPVMEPAPVMAAEVSAPASAYAGFARRGVVTAGDIDDGLNLAAFGRYLAKASQELGLPQANLATPVLAQMIGPDGQPAPGVRVTLRKPGAAEAFYDGYSGVDGRVTVFPGVLRAGRLTQVELRAFPQANGTEVVERFATGSLQQVQLASAPGWHPDFLDLVFVLDTTGSMGDELAWLTREMAGVVRQAQGAAPGVDIRFGLVVYRDQGDEYVVRNFGFTGEAATLQGWLRAQSADGGGDEPEAAAAALQSAVALEWRRGKGERLLIHIADAPPHQGDAAAYLAAARQAAAQGVQVFGLGASGVSPASEDLMRQAAVMTGGRYMFLTDDSGVGLPHAEPTVACYRVTTLKDLMQRVLRSELGGQRIEAAGGQVLREVGSYAGGVCRS
jgi:hypothetical protein